jgi:LAO/AO transport system kinase
MGGGGDALASAVIAGHVPSAARLIRGLEDARPEAYTALRALYPKSGRAHVVGVTGPPGAGKSTLVNALVAGWRARGLRVAVLAVDPSSPFSGGALLGDRVRMQQHATDPGVFIRSMASRGHAGGLARASWEASVVFDAMGFDVVVVETVGVGQGEIEVVSLAHTTLLVCLPGSGDAVQASKAGLLEAADVWVLNKGDAPGADEAMRHLHEAMPSAAAGAWQ